MDKISGLMPQIGWSPAQMPVTRKAPATTVEPASASSRTGGGMGAEVDTRGGGGQGAEQALLARFLANATPDPDAPTGPPPTFDVTPLEAQAAAQRKLPHEVTPPKASETPDEAPQTGGQAGAETSPPWLDLMR